MILERDSQAIAELQDGSEAELSAFEKRIAAGGDFDAYIAQARTLVTTMVAGFSAIEIAKTEFGAFPRETREVIFSIFEKLYLQKTRIDTYSVPMKKAIDDLEFEIEKFREHWFASARRNMISEGFKQVQFRAKELDEILNALPKGIPLP